jgi:hypothetical protein
MPRIPNGACVEHGRPSPWMAVGRVVRREMQSIVPSSSAAISASRSAAIALSGGFIFAFVL